MKNLLTLFCISIFVLYAQNTLAQEDKKYIEVVSKCEKIFDGDFLEYLIALESKQKDEYAYEEEPKEEEEKEEEKNDVLQDKLLSPKAKLEKIKKELATALGVPESSIQPAISFPPASLRENGNAFKITIEKSQRSAFEKKIVETKVVPISDWKISKATLNEQNKLEAEKKVLNEAIDLGMNKIKFIAQSKGFTLGEIISIEEISNANNDFLEQIYGNSFTQMMALLGGNADGDKVKINTAVKVRFKIK